MIAPILFILFSMRSASNAAIIGPTATLVSNDAFAPARSWQPSLTPGDRSRVLTSGSLFAALAIGCCLLRSRRQTFVALVGLTVVSLGAIAFWRSSLPAIYQTGGDVMIVRTDPADASRRIIEQLDRWEFFGTREAGPIEAAIPLKTASAAIFCDRYPRDATNSRVTDNILHATLHPGDRIAVLTRSASSSIDSTLVLNATRIRTATNPAMQKLVRAEYSGPGLRPLGELDSESDSNWTTIVIARD